jgi:preprotein translocase SecE subunit
MARDRQRAKQRRRRGTSGPPPGSTRARARDAKKAAPEPAEPERDPTPAPEPTEQAQPYVDEARMAEAGVPVPEPQDDDLEPDDLDAEDGSYAPDPAVVEERAEAARRRPRRGRVLTFLGHVVDELRRVQWPDRRQTAQGTAVTLGFVVIAGGFLGLMDAIWQPIVEAIL